MAQFPWAGIISIGGVRLSLEGGTVRNFLAFVGLVVVGFVGIGYYMGWYKFDLSPGKDGKQNINVEFDTKKIGTDVEKKLDQGSELLKEKLKKENDPASPEFVGPPEPKSKPTSR